MKTGADRNRGRQTSGRGYFDVVRHGHPFADPRGRIKEHRAVLEEKLGQILDPRTMWVHHKDGNKSNNDPENLEAMSPRDHLRIHAGQRKIDGKWFSTCGACGRELEVIETNFYRHKTGHNEFYSRCIPCLRADARERARKQRVAARIK